MSLGAGAGSVSVLGLMASAIRHQSRRFLALGIVTILAMAAAVAGLAVSSYSGATAATLSGNRSELSRITLFNDVSTLPFDSVRIIRGIRGVSSVTPIIRVPVGLNESKSSIILVGSDGSISAPIVAGKVPAAGLPDDGIVLPAVADGVDLRPYLGKTVSVTYTVAITADSGITKNLPVTVAALYDPDYQVDAPIAGYVRLAAAERLAAARAGTTTSVFEHTSGFDQIDVTASSVAAVPAVTRALQSHGFHAVSEIQRLQQVPGAIELLHGAALLLFSVLLVLALASAALIAHGIAQERRREIAILRACGWAHRRVLSMLVAEAGSIVVVAGLVGCAAGAVLASAFGQQLRAGLAGSGLGPMVYPLDQIGLAVAVFCVLVIAAYATAIVRTSRKPVAAVLQGAV